MKQLRTSEEGATAVEYGIMVALIAVVIIAIVAALGGNLTETFSSVNDCLVEANETGTVGDPCAEAE